MRRIPALLLASAVAACSAPNQQEAGSAENIADSGVPNVTVSAAPGVAFAYAYSFRLPSTAVARTQEAHAQACERLGLVRCRITGMRYRLDGENDISASLAFKLDPAIARRFGKEGVDLVTAAKGALVDAEVTGTDSGAEITRLSAERAGAGDELARIDRELARSGLPAAERATLQAQRAEAANRIAAARAGTAERQASLATTPMTFDYASGPAVRGFDMSAPLTSALDAAAGSARFTLAVLLGALALLGPPALAAALLWLGWRRWGRWGRRWRDRAVAPA